MNDKTISENPEDRDNERPADESHQDRRIENDPTVKRAKSQPGEVPNRDEDEFESDGRKTPDVERQAEVESDK